MRGGRLGNGAFCQLLLLNYYCICILKPMGGVVARKLCSCVRLTCIFLFYPVSEGGRVGQSHQVNVVPSAKERERARSFLIGQFFPRTFVATVGDEAHNLPGTVFFSLKLLRLFAAPRGTGAALEYNSVSREAFRSCSCVGSVFWSAAPATEVRCRACIYRRWPRQFAAGASFVKMRNDPEDAGPTASGGA